MLSLKEIKNNYPENLQIFKRHMLREYLQYKILEIIYSSKTGNELVFIGGTALRIVYGNRRFSEDLDFDSKGIGFEKFKSLSNEITKGLERQAIEVQTNPKKTESGAFVNELKIINLLHKEGISPHEGEKLTIKVDAADQKYDFEPNIYTLDKFDVYIKIKVAPMDLILAQKFYCLLNRNRVMVRDLFDISFLIENKEVKKPDFDYLRGKMKSLSEDDSIAAEELKTKIEKELSWDDLKDKTGDLKNLLMNPSHISRIENFKDDFESWTLS